MRFIMQALHDRMQKQHGNQHAAAACALKCIRGRMCTHIFVVAALSSASGIRDNVRRSKVSGSSALEKVTSNQRDLIANDLWFEFPEHATFDWPAALVVHTCTCVKTLVLAC